MSYRPVHAAIQAFDVYTHMIFYGAVQFMYNIEQCGLVALYSKMLCRFTVNFSTTISMTYVNVNNLVHQLCLPLRLGVISDNTPGLIWE